MSARGFTLPELLLAVALGGLVLAAAVGGFSAAQARAHEAEVLARLQERAQHAFGVLEPELQMAGYGGLRPLDAFAWPASLPVAVTACRTLAAAAVPPAIAVLPGPWALACAPHAPGAVDAADVLVLTRAGAQPAAPAPGRVQMLSATSRAPAGELLLDGRLPAGVVLDAGRTELRDLGHLVLYVARRADGDRPDYPALRVKELTSIAGRPAFRDTEVVDGVEDLRVEEAWREGGAPSSGLRFARPGARPPTQPLVAVRVFLRLRSESPVGAARDQRFDYAGHRFRTRDAFPRLLVERLYVLRNPTAGDVT